MPTNAALASALQRPLSTLALVLQQPPSLVSPCSHHTATLVTDPAITALAAINLFRYATIPTTKALASYATTSVATILASYATISVGLTQGSRSGCDRQPESNQNSVDNCKTMLKTKERSRGTGRKAQYINTI
jgi:hypothetical protein